MHSTTHNTCFRYFWDVWKQLVVVLYKNLNFRQAVSHRVQELLKVTIICNLHWCIFPVFLTPICYVSSTVQCWHSSSVSTNHWYAGDLHWLTVGCNWYAYQISFQWSHTKQFLVSEKINQTSCSEELSSYSCKCWTGLTAENYFFEFFVVEKLVATFYEWGCEIFNILVWNFFNILYTKNYSNFFLFWLCHLRNNDGGIVEPLRI